MNLLLSRHKQLSIRKPENVTMAAATVTESNIRKWFCEIERFLKDRDLLDALKDPRRILNGDETSFLFDPVTKSVVATKGNRNVYMVQKSDPKKNVTVLFTFDAEGYIFPPDVILPFKRFPKQLLMSFGADWGIGKSEKGWMDSENFMAYIRNILHPSLVKRNVPFPVVYFVDGHSSHTGIEAAELCSELNIILIALYPNATHIMQPADVAIFKPLKNSWSNCVDEWKLQNEGEKFTIEKFGPLLQRAMDRGITVSTVLAGFRKCGLYPFDANAIDYSRCIATSDQVVTDSSVQSITPGPVVDNSTLGVIVDREDITNALQLIGMDRIKAFHMNNQQLGGADKVLYDLYHQFFAKFNNNRPMECESENPLNESPDIFKGYDLKALEESQAQVRDFGINSEQTTVFENITNSTSAYRRASISTCLHVPNTPKRKNVKRNYTQKRHFILTAEERLRELEEKQKEKQELEKKKQENMKMRALKKKIKEEKSLKAKESKMKRMKAKNIR